MLTIHTIEKDGEPTYFLEGSIDEADEFYSLQVNSKNELHVDGMGVTRINSVGVKKWIRFFETAKVKNVRVYFYRVSPALVEQFNMIKNFGIGGTMVSAVFPFLCPDCAHTNAVIRTKEDSVEDLDRVTQACEECGKTNLKFDDDIDSYKYFWKL
jgi:hypothetical protein